MGRTVLVVDDDPDIRVLARVTLQSAGFNVLEASSGSEALLALDTQGPDGMLLDIRMPGMDGWEVLDRLRALDRLGDLRVVVFSAHEMASAPQRVRDKGGVGYLPKPFMPEELVDAMNSALSSTDLPQAAETVATGNVDEAMQANLFAGEEVEISAEALSRVALQFFHRCQVYLTDRRLVLLKPAWPWGYKLAASHPREDCSLKTVKHKIDGSCLVIVGHPDGVECLYFARRWRPQADGVIAALSGESGGPTVLEEA